MLKIETGGEIIRVLHNEKLILFHSPDNPFIMAGRGEKKAVRFGDNWVLRGSVKERTALHHAHYDSNRSTLRFAGGDYSVTFSIAEAEDTVVLTPQRATNGLNCFWLSFPAKPNGHIFGGGEQFRRINLRGRKVPVWVRRQRFGSREGPEIDIVGKWNTGPFPQATFVTDECVFVHVDCPSYAVMDFTGSRNFHVETWEMPGVILMGAYRDLPVLLKTMTKMLGRQPLLPPWAYTGAWLDVGGGMQSIVAQLEKAVSAGAAVTTLWLRDWTGLRKEPRAASHTFYDWVWNYELYPKLPEIIREISSQGIHTLAYINPHLSIEGRLFAEASMKGYLVRKKEGGVSIHDMGGFMAGHIDLTNPDAVDWYKKIIGSNVMSLGFSGYVADMGGFVPPDAVLYSGEDPLSVHNRWPQMWARLNREALRESGHGADGLFITQTGTGGVGGFAMLAETGGHVTGWGRHDGLPSALTAALSLAFSGIGISHAPIGGSHTRLTHRSKELIIRWGEFAAFTPVMRFCRLQGRHWEFDTDRETGELLARLTRIHEALSPYIRACLRENALDGMPVMRPMPMVYPNDPQSVKMRDVYMLGDELLVAPVMQQRMNTRRLHLPDGDWIHLWTGNAFVGGECEVNAPLGKPPVFVKPGGAHYKLFMEMNKLD
jgi:alpha-glucosidase